jgi:hypothetical protein
MVFFVLKVNNMEFVEWYACGYSCSSRLIVAILYLIIYIFKTLFVICYGSNISLLSMITFQRLLSLTSFLLILV